MDTTDPRTADARIAQRAAQDLGRASVPRVGTHASAGTHPGAVTVIKTVHTAVFFLELVSIGWLVVSGLVGRRDRSVAVAGVAVALEAGVFVGNGMVCPLTPLTERMGASSGTVSDIFLPAAVARTIPIWSSSLIVLALLLHLRAVLSCRVVGRQAVRGPDGR